MSPDNSPTLSTDHGGDRFMTMHLSVIDSKARTMRWVSAGHDPVTVFDPADNGFTEVGEGDLPLGKTAPLGIHRRALMLVSNHGYIALGS